jgi:hypothetical protein
MVFSMIGAVDSECQAYAYPKIDIEELHRPGLNVRHKDYRTSASAYAPAFSSSSFDVPIIVVVSILPPPLIQIDFVLREQ